MAIGAFIVGLLWKLFTLHQRTKDSAESIIKLTTLVEAVTKESRETSVELRMLSQTIGVQIEGMQKTLVSIHRRLDTMMTKDEVAILTKHYDEVADHSLEDRSLLHRRVDSCLTKGDHATLCQSYRKTS